MRPEEKLSRMIQCETVSSVDNDNAFKFKAFHEVLASLFPNVFSKCETVKFGEALLIRWEGDDHDNPIVLMSHQDVVAAEGKWQEPPFSGAIKDGKIWGRGTVDTKGSLMCIFEAVDELIADGYVPNRDIYISSSDGEEVNGAGASLAVDYLEAKKIHPYLVLDEGGMIKAEPIKGAKGRFAMMGTLEKGTCNFRFIARGNGGHASAPGKNTPLVRLGEFMADIEKHDPFKAKMNDTTITASEGTFSITALPFMSVIVPFVVPFTKTFAPVTGPIASVTVTVIVLFCCTSFTTGMSGNFKSL